MILRILLILKNKIRVWEAKELLKVFSSKCKWILKILNLTQIAYSNVIIKSQIYKIISRKRKVSRALQLRSIQIQAMNKVLSMNKAKQLMINTFIKIISAKASQERHQINMIFYKKIQKRQTTTYLKRLI